MNSNWSYGLEMAKLGFDLCDLWPLPFAWTSLLSLVITPGNFMIWWQEHCEKSIKDRQMDGGTDGWTDRSVLRAAWLQLKKRGPRFQKCNPFPHTHPSAYTKRYNSSDYKQGNWLLFSNLLRPSRQPRPSLVQIMACHLFGAKPLSEWMLEYCRLEAKEQS